MNEKNSIEEPWVERIWKTGKDFSLFLKEPMADARHCLGSHSQTSQHACKLYSFSVPNPS